MHTIPANDFGRLWQDTRQQVLDAVAAVGESGWYILGGEVEEFERALAGWWGRAEAVGVASGLDALELALRAAGMRAGDKALTTPLSAFASTLAIVKAGGIPVFVDCDEAGLLCLDAAEDALRARPDIRFMIPVHLYGQSLDLARLEELQTRFGVTIIEDCAQSIGAHFEGRPTGTVGRFAATSFYPTKNLGAMGDGGAVLMPAAGDAAAIRELRDYGQSGKYRHTSIGYNSRLDELQAAFLRRVYLPKLAKWTERRREVARHYQEGIVNPRLRVPGDGGGCCYHLFPVLVEDGRKQDYLEHLRARGIGAGEHYPVAIVDQPALQEVPHEIIGGCATARRICRTEVSLPVHPYLTDGEVARVIEVCNLWQ